MLACMNHPGRAAELECAPCRAFLCPACARYHADGKTAECLRCGALLLPLKAGAGLGPVSRAPADLDAHRPLGERLFETPRSLLQPTALIVIAAVAVFQYLSGFLPFLPLLSAGVTAALFFDIVVLSAEGRTSFDTPDFIGFGQSIILPLLRYLATVVPFIVVVVAGGVTLLESLAMGPVWTLRAVGPWVVLGLVWLAFWPLLIIVGAITGSIVAIFDPRGWYRTLHIVGRDYFVAAGAFYVILAVDALVLRPLLGWIVMHVPLPVIPSLLVNFVSVWLLVLRARILGEACRPYMGE